MKKTKFFPIRLGLSMFFACFLAVTVNAANFTVDSIANTPDANTADNVCADADGRCTLRAAIEQANASAGADTINFDATVFASAQTIFLNGAPLPWITDDLTITGTSPVLLTIDGTGNHRIFFVIEGVTVFISNLTAANGYAGEAVGAGILNSGTLTLTNLVVRNNTVNFGAGGGIHNLGNLSVINSSIYDNETGGGLGSGAGISNAGGSVGITNSIIRNNIAGEGFISLGGGIANEDGTVTITNSTVSENEAGQIGGGISSFNGVITLINSVISDNSAPDGAGIINVVTSSIGDDREAGLISGIVNITNSTIRDNTASGNGGGIFNDGGNIGINSSTIGSSTDGGSNRAANGGGIYNLNGSVNFSNSTISGNFAGNIGGGYYGFADLGVTTLTSDSSTIAFNTAVNGGGIAVSSITGFNSAASISNTIISNNAAAAGPDVSDNSGVVPGTIISTGYNIIQNTSGATIVPVTGDQFGVNPLLLPLAGNGGPTETHALSSSPGAVSPAIDKGNSQQSTDQRGFQRPVDNPSIPPALFGNNSDIGAFELQTVTAASVQIQGRVLNSSGNGLSKIRVILTENDGANRIAITNPFGYYRFDNVKIGQTVVIEAVRKGFKAQTRVLSVNEFIENLDFVFDETKTSRNISTK